MYHNKYCLYSYFPNTVHIVVYIDDDTSFKNKVKKIKIVTFEKEISRFWTTSWEKKPSLMKHTLRSRNEGIKLSSYLFVAIWKDEGTLA